MSSTTLYSSLAKGLFQWLMEFSIVGERAPPRLCAGYSVETGGSSPATITMTYPIKCVYVCYNYTMSFSSV